MSFAPSSSNNKAIACPAAPAPLKTILQSSNFLLTIFNALISAARVTTAVPCWSSWKIGISVSSFKRLSISKHLGAEMSSRLIPPNEPAISFTVFTMSSTFLLLIQRGNASTPPNSLNKTHFPSITGIPASGPMSPSPKTAVPSVTTATRFHLRVSSNDLFMSLFISRQGCATPGV